MEARAMISKEKVITGTSLTFVGLMFYSYVEDPSTLLLMLASASTGALINEIGWGKSLEGVKQAAGGIKYYGEYGWGLFQQCRGVKTPPAAVIDENEHKKVSVA